MTSYEKHDSKKTKSTGQELETLLYSLAGTFTKVYLVLDALDECDTDTRPHILGFLQKLQKIGDVNLMATTRGIPDGIEMIPECPRLEVRASDSDEQTYIRARLVTLPKRVRENSDV